MNLLEKIQDIEDNSDFILPKRNNRINKKSFSDFDAFSSMANFIINMDSNDLDENQLQEMINIIEDIETYVNELEESGNPRLSGRSTVGKNSYSKKWYRANKSRVKKKKEEFMRSSEGRRKQKEKTEKQGQETRDVKYHTRKKSSRNGEYERREHGK